MTEEICPAQDIFMLFGWSKKMGIAILLGVIIFRSGSEHRTDMNLSKDIFSNTIQVCDFVLKFGDKCDYNFESRDTQRSAI